MFKKFFKSLNPLSIHSDDELVVEIIEKVINHPNTFIYNRNSGNELILRNHIQEMNILIRTNRSQVEVDSLKNCITYSIKIGALSKIEKLIKEHNSQRFDKTLEHMMVNKKLLTNKILESLKED